ncbi:hypothetical protein CI105_00800 [Candidatus Izimaplasma bacterium ZiA1]|uniref:metallophosphoesterase n=1 Tax=Candidatus Izimoplasma sp. ZiA1 TaxID=2024899 RepID=UPI000BAA6899|nr:hypothetical protein CI105_00800 [Candidatus Izimaplasma bacterium ZiA1]
MRYFIVSDIHGHYNVLINELGNNKFSPLDKLIVIGDLFDRGKQSKEVLIFLKDLWDQGKCEIIMGNHDIFLLDFLNENYSRVQFNIEHNGFAETLLSLSGLSKIDDNYQEIRSEIIKNFPYLQSWLESFPLYKETKNYIFVHGGIDGSNPEWKKSTVRDFVWGRQYNLPRHIDKTIIAGHHRVATIRNKDLNDYDKLFLEDKSQFDILYCDGKILIDRFVEVSNELNILILKDL